MRHERAAAGWRLVDRGTVRSDAGSRGLIGENTPHDEPTPARTIKGISLLSFWALFLFFVALAFMVLNLELTEKVDNFFLWLFYFFESNFSNWSECA
jgi:hypothetical protein